MHGMVGKVAGLEGTEKGAGLEGTEKGAHVEGWDTGQKGGVGGRVKA